MATHLTLESGAEGIDHFGAEELSHLVLKNCLTLACSAEEKEEERSKEED